MATVCYAWNDAPFKWSETPFTWKEGCIIEKIIVNPAGGMQSLKRIRQNLKKLSEDEKQTIIGLFVRLNVDEITFEQQVNKSKNKKVSIKLKDIEVLVKEQKFINVNVKNIN
jgi:hypothetical protein